MLRKPCKFFSRVCFPRFRQHGCLPFTTTFRKFWLESKLYMTFRVVPAEISGRNGTSEKVVLFFGTECSKRKFVYHLFKPNLWYQFQALAAIFCLNNNSLTSLLKWLHNLWNFLAIIPTRVTCLRRSNYPGVEFVRTAYQFRKNVFRKLIKK